MCSLTLSEKYVLLAMNEKGKLNFFLGLKNGIYVSSLLELYKDKVITNFLNVEVSEELPERFVSSKEMYDFVKENKGKSVEKILKSVTSPFQSKLRKALSEDVMKSVETKVMKTDKYESMTNEIVGKIKEQLKEVNDIESLLLAKLLFEFKIAGRFFEKEERKALKALLKNNTAFSGEIKEMMDVINSLAVVGALAGAGAV